MEKTHDDPALAEAIARRDESRAQILRSRANAAGGNSSDRLAKAFEKLADQADRASQQSAKALGNIEPERPDPEGTARQLADSEGNFAANAEVAAVGGIGIKASNTDVTTGKPATTAEQAGEAATPDAQTVIGDRPVEGAEGVAATDIPTNWRELSWQERRSLAAKFSDTPITNGEEANKAIEAELAKRG